MSTELIVFLVVLGFIILTSLFLLRGIIKIYIQAYVSGSPVTFMELIGMSLRKTPPHMIVSAKIILVQAGIINITTCDLESVYLARQDSNDVMVCVNALIIAHKDGLNFNFTEIQAHHFAGGHVIELVQAMNTAQQAKMPLTLDEARANDLAGRDILDAVHTTITP
ncbi:MAG: flotillin-like FloA family protein [Phycisphaerae bacterium]|nr:flotillin-like FloA family protein [Phycisphaerae bacterium]